MNILDKIEKLERETKIISVEIDLLRKQIGKVNFEENKYKRWRANQGEYYWYVDYIGDIFNNYETYTELDNFRYSTGNYFRTEKEAEEYKENLITKQKLKDLALRLNEVIEINWKDPNRLKIFIALNIAQDKKVEEALIKAIKSGV